MRKTKTESYQVWFPGKVVWELWFVDSRRGARLMDTCEDSRLLAFKASTRKRVLAQPICDQKPMLMTSSAWREAALVQDASYRVQANRDLGDAADRDGFGVEPISGVPPKSLARIDIPLSRPLLTQYPDNFNPELIVPSAALMPVPQNGIAIWNELKEVVLAVEKDGGVIHYETLTGNKSVEFARQTRVIIKKLVKDGVLVTKPSIHLWGQFGMKIFKDVLNLDICPGVRADPSNSRAAVGMVPIKFRVVREQKSLARRKLVKKLAINSSLAVATMIVVGAFAGSYFQAKQQADGIAQIRPDVERIAVMKSRWDAMAPAVDRNSSVLEVWRQLSTIPSSSKISISRLWIDDDRIELTCQALTDDAAVDYVSDLSKMSSFAAFSWDYSAPEILRDGTSLFVLKGFR